MELEEDIIRMQVCEKCFEHDRIDPHCQIQFFNAFNECKGTFMDHGFKIIKNMPYKYLKKIADSKLSTKRYLDQNTNKVQQYPRKGAFQVYYMNILIFSKLQSANFPDPILLLQIAKKIKKIYKNKHILECFQPFRDLEIDRKKNQKLINSIYQFIKLVCPQHPKQANLDIVFQKIQKKKPLQNQKNKIIYPYSFYAHRQKNFKIQKIYCPSLNKKTDSLMKNLGSKTSSCKQRPPTSPSKLPIFTSSQVFNSARGVNNLKVPPKSDPNELKNKSLNENPNLLKKSLDKNENRVSEAFLRLTDKKAEKKRQSEIKARSLRGNQGQDSPKNQLKRKSDKVDHSKISKLEINLKKQNRKSVFDQRKSCRKSGANSIFNQDMKKLAKNYTNRNQIENSQKQLSTEKIEKGIQISMNGKSQSSEQQCLWKSQKHFGNIPYEQASIIEKFSQKENFLVNLFQNEYKNEKSQHANFEIKGQELSWFFTIKTLRSEYKPKQIILFPEIFNFVKSFSHKLMYVVNLLLSINPLFIVRLFENKKFINPFGLYCIWLRQLNGSFIPIIINDEFPYNSHNQLIYSKVANQNSIWFMLLEKAVAKMLGGYHKIDELTIGDLLTILLGCPKVQFKNLNPQRVAKILNQNIFYNRHAHLYTLSTEAINGKVSSTNQIMKVSEFTKNTNEIKDSIINLVKSQSKNSLTMKKFLLEYNFLSLIFFNPNFTMNQIRVESKSNLRLITCQIKSKFSKNECYLLFNNFPGERITKVSIFKKLTDEEPVISEFMNSLEEEKKKYEYFGEISKKQNFFFETSLDVGQYVCLMETKFQETQKMNIFIYSQKQININDIKTHTQTLTTKKKSDSYYLKESKNEQKSKIEENKENKEVKVQNKSLKKQKSTIIVEKSKRKCQTAASGFRKKKQRNEDFRIRKKFLISDNSDETC